MNVYHKGDDYFYNLILKKQKQNEHFFQVKDTQIVIKQEHMSQEIVCFRHSSQHNIAKPVIKRRVRRQPNTSMFVLIRLTVSEYRGSISYEKEFADPTFLQQQMCL